MQSFMCDTTLNSQDKAEMISIDRKHSYKWKSCWALIPWFTAYPLCDIEQVTYILCAAASSRKLQHASGVWKTNLVSISTSIGISIVSISLYLYHWAHGKNRMCLLLSY